MEKRLLVLSRISKPTKSKILLIVIDGLGGLRHSEYSSKKYSHGMTELQFAKLPNLDRFVRHELTVTGLIYPVRRGYIPGSGPGHLGLFGYDPFYYEVGRGAIEAADLPDSKIGVGDIIARFNFCTIDERRTVVDRRASRITDGKRLAEILNKKIPQINGARTKVISTKEHRGVFVIKAKVGLDPRITDTDPQENGKMILKAAPVVNPGERAETQLGATEAANIVNMYTSRAEKVLRNESPANAIIFRGFSTFPDLPKFRSVYQLNAAAIAIYPLYRGLGRILGMAVLDGAKNFEEEVKLLNEHYGDYDFFYLHYKDPDARGEDGDFLGKVKTLEHFDSLLPQIVSENSAKFKKGEFKFDVITITGDHATPSVVGAHTHHSVPLAINSNFMKGYDKTKHFTEEQCIYGSLGRLEGIELMPFLLSNARKLNKFEGFERD